MKTWMLALLMSAAAEGDPWVIYFQENCLPCRKQLRELDCFAAQGLSIKVVGIGRSRVRLRHELDRQTQGNFAFEMKSWEEAQQLGIFATPSHDRISATGQREKLMGVIPCKKS